MLSYRILTDLVKSVACLVKLVGGAFDRWVAELFTTVLLYVTLI
jgi:hypothetical protein